MVSFTASRASSGLDVDDFDGLKTTAKEAIYGVFFFAFWRWSTLVALARISAGWEMSKLIPTFVVYGIVRWRLDEPDWRRSCGDVLDGLFIQEGLFCEACG